MYKNLQLLGTLLIVLISANLSAQDVTVQSFNYDSQSRDSLIQFPTDDHNKWEKILMIYSMRCKDGLVSTTSDRNRGCGEWDYSCNTYISDSTQVDSLKRTSPDYVISNFSGDNFDYTTQPTYQYFQSVLKPVEYTSTISEENFAVNTGAMSSNILSASMGEGERHQYVLTKEDLELAGTTAGNISGLKLDVQSGEGDFTFFKVRMKHQSATSACIDDEGWMEVFYQNATFNATDNWLRFYQDFDWNGQDDLAIDISYKSNSSSLVLNAKELGSVATISANNNGKVVRLNNSGNMTVEGDFSSIDNEITIAFRTKGDDILPVNTTIIEGFDDLNRRQVNIHLPWSNGSIFWDCGNEGNYDRIDKMATTDEIKGEWIHWAFTKNAATGSMKIYKNGQLWHSGTGMNNPIKVTQLKIGSDINETLGYYGWLDDVSIWNKELSSTAITDLVCEDISPSNSNYANLLLNYNFDNDTDTQVMDSSPNGNNSEIGGVLQYQQTIAREITGNVEASNLAPSITVVKGSYQTVINDIVILDSLENSPNKVEEYAVIGTDLTVVNTMYYYEAGDMPVFDDDNNVIDNVNVATEGTIAIGTLNHYSKGPMQMEIMSFVTPYGINLDFGLEGESWTFDVTDMAPILKGGKRMFLSGGIWQEDMDIKFLFYEGTPPRNVNSIQQIWPVISANYTEINTNQSFEPRIISKSSEDAYVVAKTTITGHGQEGEFIPRTHGLTLDNIPFQWEVWMECADNPVYPQGGTWVYDRAGWCPGAPSMTEETDMTFLLEDDIDAELDYNVNTGSGDSRYIVSSQLVKYGPANFVNDASINDIIYPSEKIEHGRFNPNCGRPKVVIKNTGSETLTSATITYGILGGETKTYEWTGNLAFLSSQEVELDFLSTLAASEDPTDFFAEVSSPNGVADEYENNNEQFSAYSVVDMYDTDVIIQFKTNNNFTETGYRVFDGNGNQIYTKGPGGLNSNTLYRDTLKDLNGCYRIEITDFGENGLDWWANPSGGSGYVRVRDNQGNINVIATDFGKIVDYSFIAGEVMVNTNSPVSDSSIDIFPNPTSGIFNVMADQLDRPSSLEVMDDTGRILYQIPIDASNNFLHERIDLSNYASGLYIVKIAHDGGSVTKKLVKY